MTTLLLDQREWDLVLDARGNIAVASAPYALAQDASSCCRTFEGECYWNTDLGVPYLTQIFGRNIPPALLRQEMVNQANTVPGVVSSQFFMQSLRDRILAGQIQVVSVDTGIVTAAPVSVIFTVTNPQGLG